MMLTPMSLLEMRDQYRAEMERLRDVEKLPDMHPHRVAVRHVLALLEHIFTADEANPAVSNGRYARSAGKG